MMTIKNDNRPSYRDLPRELRDQIWRDVLPTIGEGPALFPYKRGCWEMRKPAEGDTDYNPDSPDDMIEYFRHKDLRSLQFDMPMAFVNREAYEVVLKWLNENEIKISFRSKPIVLGQELKCTFQRSFNPDSDVLYLSEDIWDDFRSEPMLLPFEHPLPEYYHTHCEVYHIAISELMCLREDLDFDLLWNDYPINKIYVIVGSQPDQAWRESEETAARWEIDSSNATVYEWKNGSWIGDSGNGELVHPSGGGYKEFEPGCFFRRLSPHLIDGHVREFSVHVVRSVQH